MNLMREKWIPVKRRDGRVEDIAPFEVTDQIGSNPIIALAAPRPDFNGALIQFLIGLFQTIYAPKNETEWVRRMENPPQPGELQKLTEKVAFAFELFGDGPRFMQDVQGSDSKNDKSIAQLLIDSPGDSTIKSNRDFFIKDNHSYGFCDKCTAIALYTMQTNATKGGRGNLPSVRGNGHLTTLVQINENEKPHSLWENLWLNVLETNFFQSEFTDIDFSKIFPWIDDKIFKYKDGDVKKKTPKPTTSKELHPYSIFWGLPRKIFLLKENTKSECSICNRPIEKTVQFFKSRALGIDYENGNWVHSLSPYVHDESNFLFAQKPRSGGILYNYWVSVAVDIPGKSKAAQVITAFRQRRYEGLQLSIRAFGYEMEDMVPKCWYEAEIPLFQIAKEYLPAFEEQASQVLAAAELVKRNLRQAIKAAWFDENQSVKGDFGSIEIAFLKNTESDFFEMVQKILHGLQSGQKDFQDIKTIWLKRLNAESLLLFDATAEAGSIEFENIERIVHARKNLAVYNFGAVTKKALGLPVLEKSKERSKQKA